MTTIITKCPVKAVKPRISPLISVPMLALLLAAAGALAEHPDDHETMMHHGSRPVPTSAPAPSIRLEASRDPHDGINLWIQLQNFELVPPVDAWKPAGSSAAVSGHAHLLVNGEKRGRIYAGFHHVSGHLLKKGVNTISVSLNDDNHSAWLVNGEELKASLEVDTREAGPQTVRSQP